MTALLGSRVWLAGLIATWNERDLRYVRAGPLTKPQVAVVIEWRKREARDLPEPERGLALSVIREWKQWRP